MRHKIRRSRVAESELGEGGTSGRTDFVFFFYAESSLWGGVTGAGSLELVE